MSLNNTASTSCPNCGHAIPAGASICPSCGWEAGRSGVWPPSIAPAEVPAKPRRNHSMPVLQVIAGVMLGLAVAVAALLFSLSGGYPTSFVVAIILALAIFLSLCKTVPYFAYGALTGTLIGAGGIGACFYSFSHFY